MNVNCQFGNQCRRCIKNVNCNGKADFELVALILMFHVNYGLFHMKFETYLIALLPFCSFLFYVI